MTFYCSIYYGVDTWFKFVKTNMINWGYLLAADVATVSGCQALGDVS